MRLVGDQELGYVLLYELSRIARSTWRSIAGRDPDGRRRGLEAATAHMMARLGKWLFYGDEGVGAFEVDIAAVAALVREELERTRPETFKAILNYDPGKESMRAIASRIYARLAPWNVLVQEPAPHHGDRPNLKVKR